MKRSPHKTIGTSTLKPTVTLALGKYVVVKARAGGTARVYFQVPERLRPIGWLPALPLPRVGPRKGNLADANEVARIIQDAADLHADLLRVRAGAEAKKDERTMSALVDAWERSSSWPANKKTQVGYRFSSGKVLVWAKTTGNKDPTRLTRDGIEKFLAEFKDRPSTQKATLKILRMIMDQACAKGWRTDNPCDKIKIHVPKSHAEVWEQSDVDAYVAAAMRLGRPSLALIILLEWEIGQRLTDVRGFRPGAEYDAPSGVFRFYQSKTKSYVTIPVSPTLRDLLAPAVDGKLFMFHDEVTGHSYGEQRLSKEFAKVRDEVRGERHLLLKWLRHSCVVQLARSGCTPIEIAAITGHAITSVVSILSVYCPRDNDVAWNAQAKRGLVEKRSEG